MSKYFTVVFSAQAKTEDKSVDIAIENYVRGKMDDNDQIMAIRTYDDISAVSLKQIRQ